MSDLSILSEDVRAAIDSSWDNGEYAASVRDAFLYLSDLIRDKGDCEGDGQQLITAAFGGLNPKIKINNLTNDTDRSEQEGFILLLRGIYLTVRNPRSHQQTDNSMSAAYRILCFMDWLAEKIRGSRGTYGQNEFLSAVADPDFVNSDDYAQALLDRIPHRKHADFLLSLYRNDLKIKPAILSTVFRCYYKQAPEQSVQVLTDVFAEELRSTKEDRQRMIILTLMTPQMWSRLDRVALIRTENRVLASLAEGTEPEEGKARAGWLATWGAHLLPFFSDAVQVLKTVGKKVLSDDKSQLRYVQRFIISNIWALFSSDTIENMKQTDEDFFLSFEEFPLHVLARIKEGSRPYYDFVQSTRYTMPEHVRAFFQDAMSNFKEVKEPTNRSPPSEFEDDIPF